MRRSWSPAVFVFVLAGCGGQAMTGGSGSSGASMTGNAGANASAGRAGNAGGSSPVGGGSGRSGSGTSEGGRASGGTAGNVGGSDSGGSDSNGGEAALGGSGPIACCEAAPTCDEGEREDPRASACGTPCREVTLCCATIHCCPATSCGPGAENPMECQLVCDPSDVQLSECPPDVTCTQISNCGLTAYCAPASALEESCDPDAEPDRNYVAMGDTCFAVDYVCPENTESFFNDCGCGCEQAESCPDFVDCQPGPEPNPDCNEDALAECPYTIRAL